MYIETNFRLQRRKGDCSENNGQQLLAEDVSADRTPAMRGVRSSAALSLTVRPLIQPSFVQQRFQTNAAAAPGASGKERVNRLVEEISRLTLLETADLISQLKAAHSKWYGD